MSISTKKAGTLLVLAIMMTGTLSAQDKDLLNSYLSFKQQSRQEYYDFRDKANKDYAEFMKDGWKWFKGEGPLPVLAFNVPEIPPLVFDDIEIEIEDNLVIIDDFEELEDDLPIPKPIIPIVEKPKEEDASHDFLFLGERCTYRFPINSDLQLKSTKEEAVASFWTELSNDKYLNFIFDCEAIRNNLKLCDWAYVLVVKEIASTLFPSKVSEQNIIQAYILTQSGFKIHLARDNGGVIHFLAATSCDMYGYNRWKVGSDYYYLFEDNDINELYIFTSTFPDDKPIRMDFKNSMALAKLESSSKTVKSQRYPDASVTYKVNKNLIDFFNAYPMCYTNNDGRTKWRFYAQVPMDETVRGPLYSAFRRLIAGKKQLEATEIILNWIQTGFKYEYDDVVWGGDRPFFSEESLYYPYCDCEDRAILFSRMIRDLLKLDVALIYYPGHLAAAVNFTDSVKGDYINFKGKKYVICDPTYIGAPVGLTMPDMDNSTAFVIEL